MMVYKAKTIPVGSTVEIKAKDSIYYGEWGKVVYVDDDNVYSVAIANDTDHCPIFERNELKVLKLV